MPATITCEVQGMVARVTLNRPDVRNAFNETLVAELTEVFGGFGQSRDVRAVILSGAGKTFCAGADLEWMKRMSGYSFEENRDDARRMCRMFETIDRCAVPVVVRAHGAALGGACGLVSCGDIVVAGESCQFGLTEVKLGIIPAVISPFVISKIGVGHARSLFMTGERFAAGRALAIGLVHHVVADGDLDAAVERVTDELLTSGPAAVREAKAWIRKIAGATTEAASAMTPDKIAELRASPEGREGITAFLEKRKPEWSREG